MTVVLAVDGMMCEACVGHVTRALRALPGVKSAVVNLPDERAVVDFDASMVGAADMIAAVVEEGYTASVIQ
jgi:copper chaperone CopZ